MFLAASVTDPAPSRRPAAWQPYIGGRIRTAELPCGYFEMTRPDMLVLAWRAVSEWTVQPAPAQPPDERPPLAEIRDGE